MARDLLKLMTATSTTSEDVDLVDDEADKVNILTNSCSYLVTEFGPSLD